MLVPDPRRCVPPPLHLQLSFLLPYRLLTTAHSSLSSPPAGVFYVSRMDGVIDVWDYYQRQSTPTYSHKVSDHPLSSISVQGSPQGGGGRLVAVGDVTGTVSLLEVSENLAVVQPNEKLMIGSMFERESKREENLEKRALALARAAKAASGKPVAQSEPEVDPREAAMEETLLKVDSDFMAVVRGAAAEESASTAAAAEVESKDEGKEQAE
jgi:dynein intermediate chain 2